MELAVNTMPRSVAVVRVVATSAFDPSAIAGGCQRRNTCVGAITALAVAAVGTIVLGHSGTVAAAPLGTATAEGLSG